MSADKNQADHVPVIKNAAASKDPVIPDRRTFLLQAGAAATLASCVLASPSVASAQSNDSSRAGAQQPLGASRPRVLLSYQNRVNAAHRESLIPVPGEISNGDERNFPNYIGNYSKGLVHNSIGEVSSSSYQSFLAAVNSGNPALFEQIQMGGTTPLVNPQAGLAFDLEGCDSHQLAIGTPPSVASRTIADAAVESYWMALCRDVNFTQYGNEPLTQAAIAELNSLPEFHGPKPVTPQNLFRGYTAGDVSGPVPIAVSTQAILIWSVAGHTTHDDLRAGRRLHD